MALFDFGRIECVVFLTHVRCPLPSWKPSKGPCGSPQIRRAPDSDPKRPSQSTWGPQGIPKWTPNGSQKGGSMKLHPTMESMIACTCYLYSHHYHRQILSMYACLDATRRSAGQTYNHRPASIDHQNVTGGACRWPVLFDNIQLLVPYPTMRSNVDFDDDRNFQTFS